MEQLTLWLTENWQGIFGALIAIVSGFAIPVTRKVLFLALKTVLTEKALIQVVIYLGDMIVKSTKNNFDNTLWVEVRKALFNEIK